MKITHKGKMIKIDVERAGFFGRLMGLMFKSSNAENLLFEFSEEGNIAIHSFFCRPFAAVWLDDKANINKVLLVNKWLPFISGKGKYLIEIPVNSRNKEIINFLVEKRKV